VSESICQEKAVNKRNFDNINCVSKIQILLIFSIVQAHFSAFWHQVGDQIHHPCILGLISTPALVLISKNIGA
jgi:hypothetical protein